MQSGMLAAVIGVIVGVVLRSVVPIGWDFTLMLILIALMSGIGSMRYRHCIERPVILVGIFIIMTAVGVIRMDMVLPHTIMTPLVGTSTTLSGRVVAEPDVRDGYTNLTIRTKSLPHLVLVRVRTRKQFRYLDEVQVRGVVEIPQDFSGDTGRIFHYRGYLAKSGVYYLIRTRNVYVNGHQASLEGFLFSFKQKYLTVLTQQLSEPYAALAGGITVGARRSLGVELTDQFRRAGLIHIVVLSGYNISIIIVALFILLAFLPIRIRALVALCGLVLFALMVGASATVVRASIMGGIGALGIFFSRSYSALHALLIAVVGMVLWNPLVVLYDPSFQLSALATLGLLLGAPILKRNLTWVPLRYGIRELTAVTISAQIAVLPLLVYMMGIVSFIALPVNLIVLPVIPFAMLLVFLSGVGGMVVPVVGGVLAIGAEVMLSYVTHVVTLATSLPFATLTLPSISLWWVVGAYGILILIWYRYRIREALSKKEVSSHTSK